jgi:diacylglycerol O-acyltransferase / wax synthase
VLVLGPPEDSCGGAVSRICGVIGERLAFVPRLRQRAVTVPFGLQRPVWVDDPHFDVRTHVRRAALPRPGGREELDAFLGQVLARPLPAGRPLWEMVVVEGLAAGRVAVVARLHHAMLDGVSGATAMAAFLDVMPSPCAGWTPGAAPPEGEGSAAADAQRPEALPSAVSMLWYAAASLARQPDVTLEAFERSVDAMVALATQNRRLAAEGLAAPPAPFSAPRTSLNGSITEERVAATLAVPLRHLEVARRNVDGATVNDVILSAVGGAMFRLLEERGEQPGRSLVALVPVSTRGPAVVPEQGQAADLGNYVSGMLVPLGTTVADPVDRLRSVATAARVAKDQEQRAGGDLLEGLTRALPPVLFSAVMRGAGLLRVFDRIRPPFNLVVSTVVLPDLPLWWAGCPMVEVYPAGPVVDGIGLNVTAMTYRGTVHFGLVACPRQVPDVQGVASLLEDEIASLVARAEEPGPEAGRAEGLTGVSSAR